MIYQNDERLHPDIQAIGCLFRCLCAMAEKVAGKELGANQLNHLWNDVENYWDFKNKTLYFLKPGTHELDSSLAEVAVFAGEVLDVKLKARQVGFLDGLKATFWGQDKAVPYNFSTIHYLTNGPDGHFCLGDTTGKEIWNPFNPAPKTKGVNRILLYSVQKE